ncbi:metallophosphoesterase family protein [Rhizobium halophytocola]|uniref:Phosphodiesterase n=1 Tax=Rhizobium halophytocola TaxID=735519 RepID=A0ABS4DSK5_9HYPH|nr:metallophosphoesterase family protein [Rhizobium halophytocola]MBP1848599.1 putative phosphodiesterase [Rhizobium halophytocola]
MRFAAIADIHGNDLALRAVLDHIAGQGIDRIVNLGDCFSGPLRADRTFAILKDLDIPTVRGNHDRYLVENPVDTLGPSDAHAHGQLDAAAFAWLRALPFDRVFLDEVYLCHATPQDDDVYFLETVDSDGNIRPQVMEEVERLARGIGESLILCAHSHIARSARLSDGRLVVNPGSVGCPAYDDDMPVPHKVEVGHPRACYVICDKIDNHWHIAFQQVEYDNMAMSDLARDNGRPEWASGLKDGFIR